MISIWRFIVPLIACLASTGINLAQSVVLTESGRGEVKGQVSYLKDETDTLSFSQVREKEMMPYANPARSPSFGFDRTTYWFRFEVTNRSDHEKWLLEIPYAPLDRIDLYLEQDSSWIHKVDGDIFPIAHREIPHRHILYQLSLPPQQTRTIYLKVKTISSVQLPALFWTPEQFQITSYGVQIVNGFFYGAMLIMILYQLFLFASIRDRTTLYYVLTLIAMSNVIAFFQGYTFLYLHPSRPELNAALAALSGPFFVVTSTMLTRSFLNIRQFSRVLDRLLLINATIEGLAGIQMIFFVHSISYKYHHFLVLTHCIIVLISASYCLYKKYKPALYYLLAWATLLLAAVVFTLGNLGLVPGYLGTNYNGLMIGCVLQVLLISFALGERYNVLVRENQAAKELELKRGREEKKRLEHEVKLRTEEIREQNKTLEELNRIKDKLFSIVSHDIKAPLTSLKLSLSLTKIGKISSDEFKDLSAEIENHLDQTTGFIQNLLQWAKFQLRGEAVRPVRLDIACLLNETLLLLDSEIRKKRIYIQKDIHPTVYALADPVMIQSVVRNLLTNALKFTPPSGTITIKEQISDEEIILSISDTGMGIPKSNREKIFTLESLTTPGTEQESGTGLGLVLCKEFIERNKGRIWYETSEGNGTTFYISLPLFVEELKSV